MKTIETLQEVADKQIVKTTPILNMIAKHGADQIVEVTRMVTPWGTFISGIKIVEDATA